jgi:hypothetical protein
LFCPLLCVSGAAALSGIALRNFCFSFGNAGFAVFGIFLSVMFYLMLLRILGGISAEDSRWFANILKK